MAVYGAVLFHQIMRNSDYNSVYKLFIGKIKKHVCGTWGGSTGSCHSCGIWIYAVDASHKCKHHYIK